MLGGCIYHSYMYELCDAKGNQFDAFAITSFAFQARKCCQICTYNVHQDSGQNNIKLISPARNVTQREFQITG